MKRSMVFAAMLLILMSFMGCTASKAVHEPQELTDQMVLQIMSERGYDIYGPRFRVVYNDRLIYGPNFQETESVQPESEPYEDALSETLEQEPFEETTDDVESNAPDIEPTQEEIVFNEPIEHEVPEDAFVSEDPEEELDILAQWDAYVAQLPHEDEAPVDEDVSFDTYHDEIPEGASENILQELEPYNKTDYISDIGIIDSPTDSIVEDMNSPSPVEEPVVVKVYEDVEKQVEPFVESPYPLEETKQEVEEQFSKEESSERSDLNEAEAFVVSHRKPLAVGAVFVALVFTAIGRRRRNGRKKK